MSDNPRPDPAADLVGALRWTMEALEQLLERDGSRLLSPTEAERELGYKRGYLQKPWRMPGLGLKGRRHALRMWDAWMTDLTEGERRAEWEALPLGQRRRARGGTS